MKGKIIMLLITALMLIGFASAIELDNYLLEKTINSTEKLDLGEKAIDYNPLWNKYSPIEIKNFFGFGNRLLEGAIIEHTEYCIVDCESILNLVTYQNVPLIDDIKFYEILDDNKKIEKQIQSYQIEIKDYGSDEWKKYQIGQKLPAGDYLVKIKGKKRYDKNIDWIITSQGKKITSWAEWYGSIHLKSGQSLTLGGNYTFAVFEVQSGATVYVNGSIKYLNITASVINISGTIDGTGAGYNGGAETYHRSHCNGNPGSGPGGGGGGNYDSSNPEGGSGGGGGGHYGYGGNGGSADSASGGGGGGSYGSLTPISYTIGSGGGGGGTYSNYAYEECVGGGSGGAGILLLAKTIIINGTVSSNGNNGANTRCLGDSCATGGGGGGGGEQ